MADTSFEMANDKRKGPRVLCLTLPKSKQPYLQMGGDLCAVHSFGLEGFEVWVPSRTSLPQKNGEQVNAQVLVEGSQYPVALKVVRRSERALGLSVQKQSPRLKEILEEILTPARYADSLREMAGSRKLDESLGASRIWFVGEGNSELLVWYNEHTRLILGIQLTFLGNWVYRAQYDAAQTGILKMDRVHGQGEIVDGTGLSEKHSKPLRTILDFAAQFLTAVPQPLPGNLFWQFLETGEQVYLPTDFFSDSKVA